MRKTEPNKFDSFFKRSCLKLCVDHVLTHPDTSERSFGGCIIQADSPQHKLADLLHMAPLPFLSHLLGIEKDKCRNDDSP